MQQGFTSLVFKLIENYYRTGFPNALSPPVENELAVRPHHRWF
jgi:hypothetical protein